MRWGRWGAVHGVNDSGSFLIQGATLIDSGARKESDLRVAEGRIETIAPSLTPRPGETILDGSGCWLFPGMIDVHVHFREPGLTHKGEIATESRAAVAGGVTSYMEMPNTVPQATTLEILEEKYTLAARTSAANYSFYLGATLDNLDQIVRLDPRTVCGVKLFMGASTGNMLVDSDRALEEIFAQSPTLIAAHCEETPLITAAEREARERFGEEVPFRLHAAIRSREACCRSSEKAVALARKFGARLHLLHISTAEELSLLSDLLPLTEKRITAEACIPHLWFAEEDYDRLGGKIKCNPSIKTAADRDALRRALRTGQIDLIATDHAPHTLAEKGGSYFQTPSGIPSIGEAFPAALELAVRGVLTPETVAERYAHAPATLFGIDGRGFLREGYAADLVLVRPDSPAQAEERGIRSKCGWTPFAGERFSHTVERTWVNGVLAWDRSRPGFSPPPAGQRLSFSGNGR